MRLAFLSLLLLFAAPSAMAQDNAVRTAQPAAKVSGLTVYRNIIFGASKADVRKYEKAAFYKEEGDSLYYLYKPDYFRRLIRYDFKYDKLVAIRHEAVELHAPNPYNILLMSQDEQQKLTDLYGEPTQQEFFWKNKQYEKIPSAWGRALRSRDLQIRVTWALPDSNVVLETYNGTAFYEIVYTITQHGHGEEAPPANAIDLGIAAPQGSSTGVQGARP